MTASLAKWPGALLALLAVAAHDAARPKVAFRSVSAGASHTCGLTASGAVYCWGDDFTHQLGGGNGVGSLVPVEGGPPPGAWRR